jgi:hypothetical protein
MATIFGVDTGDVRRESQRTITSLGGALCDWLPRLDRTHPRDTLECARRALVMNAMIQIHFGAPTLIVKTWIEANALADSLSKRERTILATSDDELTDQDLADLFWYIEALWAFVWVGGLIDDLPIDRPVGSELASLMPDLRVGEAADGFLLKFAQRPAAEIYQQLDLYYLAHWYARDGQLNKRDTTPFSLDIIMERRKALEWVMDSTITDWDETPANT